MGVQVHVDVSDLVARLELAAGAVRDVEPEMTIAAADLVTEVTDRIESEGDGDWPALSPATLRRRRKGGAGAKMLQDTGRVKGSMRSDHGPDFAMASSDVEYLVYHLEGGRLPKRNPFEVKPEKVERILEDIVTGVQHRIEAAL